MEMILDISKNPPKIDSLPGGWLPDMELKIDAIENVKRIDIIEGAYVLENVFSKNDTKFLREAFSSAGILAPVSVQGRQDVPDYSVGSRRATAWAPQFADALWKRIAEKFSIREMKDDTLTDWWQEGMQRKWSPYAISPMWRFMKYEKGGKHYAHYDAGFIYPSSEYRTLQSVVIYLTDSNNGGATRFIRDNQTTSVWERNHLDWTREVKEEEVIARVYPKEGSILVFDHRMCHDVEEYTGETSRIIVRTDIIYHALEN